MKIFTKIITILLLLPYVAFGQANTTVIPLNSTWKYLDNGSDQGTAWRSAAYDDTNWKTGSGMFGYDVSEVVTTVSYGNNSSEKHITTYFRKTFELNNVSSFSEFNANVFRDDAVAIYINGTEVFRNNLPDGAITYTTLASKSSNSSSAKSTSISPSVFVNGTNIIAVEVHQQKLNSSDLAFDMELIGTQAAVPTNLAPSVSISSPQNNATFLPNTTITVTALASDPEGNLARVEFYADNAKIGEATASPYTINWTPASTATYALIAKATDAEGLSTTSDAVNVSISSGGTSDQTPPTVTSINRHFPTTANTTATTLTYRVTFSEKVSEVDVADFQATTLSGNVTGVLASDAVEEVGADNTVYDVTVSTITGTGDLRLDLKNSGTNIQDEAGNAIAGGFTNGQRYTVQLPPPVGGGGTVSINRLGSFPVSKHTADKPQSKVWKHDGKWWTVQPDDDGTHVWRLDGSNWTKILTIASTSSARADCKVVGDLVHVFLFRGSSTAYLLSIQYVPATATYRLWPVRTARVSFDLDSDAETATIDVDGNGRMWLAYDTESSVEVSWSDSPYTSWSSPITLASNITDDDICAVIAMPGKVGVLWSDQNTKRFGFKTHTDGASPTAWSSDEVPSSQSAQDVRYGMADDHLNMAVASDGTLYCAVKTGFDTPGYTKVALMVRRPSGSWDNLYQVTDTEGTRAIVVLNEVQGKVKVIYTDNESGGHIYYKESSTSTIAFGPAVNLFTGVYNYSTSTKQTYNNDVVIMVTNEGSTSNRQVESVLLTDVPAANAQVAAVSAASSALNATKQALQLEEPLVAYPNPFTSSVTISHTAQSNSSYSIALYDSKGALVAALKNGHAIAGETQHIEVDGTKLNPGLYFVRLQSESGVKSLKLLLNK